jgi:hypothetical protein
VATPNYLLYIGIVREQADRVRPRGGVGSQNLRASAQAFEDCRQRLESALMSLRSYDATLAEHIRTKEITP